MKITNTLNFVKPVLESFTYRITTATVNIFMEHSSTKNRILEEAKTKRKEILYKIVYFLILFIWRQIFTRQSDFSSSFKNPNTFQIRFFMQTKHKPLIPKISPKIIDQSKLPPNRSPTSNLLRISHSLSLSLDSHTTTHSPPTHSNNLFPGNDVPIRRDYLKVSSLSLFLSPHFSSAHPEG